MLEFKCKNRTTTKTSIRIRTLQNLRAICSIKAPSNHTKWFVNNFIYFCFARNKAIFIEFESIFSLCLGVLFLISFFVPELMLIVSATFIHIAHSRASCIPSLSSLVWWEIVVAWFVSLFGGGGDIGNLVTRSPNCVDVWSGTRFYNNWTRNEFWKREPRGVRQWKRIVKEISVC